MKLEVRRNILIIFILGICLINIIFLEHLYFNIDADGVNAPVVWIEIQKRGFSALSDWYPTPDNWYFTLYPIYFLMYFITGDYGSIALMAGALIFSFSVIIFSILLSNVTDKKSSLLISSLPLAFLPDLFWTDGLVQHSFAHYSTVAFGMLMLFINIIWMKKQKPLNYTIVGALGLMICSSDMWVAPTFLLPLLLVEFIWCIRGKTKPVNFLILAIFFGVAFNHTIPKFLGINTQPFVIVEYKEIIANFHQVILMIGEMFNVFIVRTRLAYISSFFTVGSIFIFYCIFNIVSKNKASYFSLFALLSASGIIMAYAISNQIPEETVPRFFVNIAPLLFVVLAITVNKFSKVVSYILCALFITSSINSYDFHRATYENKEKDIKSYISFLKENDLHFGYGNYWEKSITSFWLSDGDIVITPITISSNGTIDFKNIRYQTMRSWYDDSYKKEKGAGKYFIALDGSEACGNAESCIDKISKKHVRPERILHHKNMTLLVFRD